jgi:hypothetical protein
MPLSKNYEPSPEEIAKACAAFRQQWTDAERRRREDYQPMILRHPAETAARTRGWQAEELTPDLATELDVRHEL